MDGLFFVKSKMKLSVIIPCFNEEATIEEVVRRTENAPLPEGWSREIILVDDGSTDSTRSTLNILSKNHQIFLRESNGGKGAAIKSGLRLASGDYIIIQDADLEYNPNDFTTLIHALAQAPIVFGSRVIAANERYSFVYFYGSRALTLLFNFLFHTNLTDITTCYKVFPSSIVPKLLTVAQDDFVFDAVYLTHTLCKSGTVIEVPITYTPRSREEGKKIRMRHGIICILAMLEVFAGKYAKFCKYFIVGGIAFFINLSVLFILTEYAQLYYLLSSAFAFLIAFMANFFLQRFWTFNNTSRTHLKRHALQFFALQVCSNLLLNAALLYLLVEYLRAWYVLAQAVVSIAMALLTFLISQRFIFKR